MIRFRTVSGTGDIACVAQLAREIWEEHYTPIIGTAQVEYMLSRYQSAAAIGEDISERKFVYDLLLIDDNPVGYMAYRADPVAGEVFLSKIYVKKLFRGQGFSRKMMGQVIDFAVGQRCGWIRLTVNRNNVNAMAAYKKLGFVVTGPVIKDIGEGFYMDDFELRKPVTMPLVKTTDINFRDPHVLVHDGTYYLYGTEGETCWTGNPGRLLVYTGKDLQNWEGPRVCFSAKPDFWADRNFWAPECHEYNGAFYLFASFKSSSRHRGTQILHSEYPDGPFLPISDGPFTPPEWECLDGTLYVDDDGQPWGVFCHEWTQIGNGSICAVRLRPDLTGPLNPEEPPVELFAARDAPWVDGVEKKQHAPDWPEEFGYVTDGPFLYPWTAGRLIMGWSSYTGNRCYTIGQAVSEKGITGPWTHMKQPIFDEDGGHGMFFHALDGRLMMAIHQPNLHCLERPVFMEMEETDDGLRVKTQSGNTQPKEEI